MTFQATYGSIRYNLYEEGVRFGCFGMAMYSLSCACYSLIIEKLISRFRAKNVYVGGLLFYCASMSLMAMTKHKIGVIVFSWGAGKNSFILMFTNLSFILSDIGFLCRRHVLNFIHDAVFIDSSLSCTRSCKLIHLN